MLCKGLSSMGRRGEIRAGHPDSHNFSCTLSVFTFGAKAVACKRKGVEREAFGRVFFKTRNIDRARDRTALSW